MGQGKEREFAGQKYGVTYEGVRIPAAQSGAVGLFRDAGHEAET
jgi:hypothetical protein